MTEDEVRAELLQILADVRAMKRDRVDELDLSSTESPARNPSWPPYVEPVEYREAREQLRAMNQEMRQELRARGEDIPPELRYLLEETNHLSSEELMKRTRAMLADSARWFEDELDHETEQRT